MMSDSKSNKRRPSEKFGISELLVRYLGGPLGLNFLLTDFGMSWNLIGYLVLSAAFEICILYTFYTMRSDPFDTLEIICLNGLNIPVSHSNYIPKS